MRGYHKKPEATAEVFFQLNGQRYFRTGDLGRMVEGKFLKITGRIKEQFKLENGKYVVPAPLEDIFARGPLIAQSFLYGLNKKHTVLLVVPNYPEWSALLEKKKKDQLSSLLPREALQKHGNNMIGLSISSEQEKANVEKLFQDSYFIHKITKEVSSLPFSLSFSV